MDDYHKLGVGPSASIISRLELLNWGSEVRLMCLYDPAIRKPYVLRFTGCRNLNLEPIEKNTPDSEVSLIGITLDGGQQQHTARVTTEGFELSLTFGRWELTWPRI